MATKREQEVIKVDAPKRSILEVTIIGEEPLIVHRFGEKARKQLKDTDSQSGPKTKKQHTARVPEDEYIEAFYFVDKKNPDARFSGTRPNAEIPVKDRIPGVPAAGLKGAMVTAGMDLGFFKTSMKRAFWVKGDYGELSAIRGSKPWMREDIVRLSGAGRAPQLRYRPQIDEWECTFTISYDGLMIDEASILNLIARAGYSVGFFEWRPEKGGSFGIFRLGTVKRISSNGKEKKK